MAVINQLLESDTSQKQQAIMAKDKQEAIYGDHLKRILQTYIVIVSLIYKAEHLLLFQSGMATGTPGEPFYVKVIIVLLTLVTHLYDIICYIPCYMNSADARQQLNRHKVVNKGADRTGPYRDASYSNALSRTPQENVTTLDAEFENVTFKYSTRECLGTRKVYKEEDEVQLDGRSFKKLVLGDYVWKTYEEVFCSVDSFGRGLRSLGLRREANVLIFAETRAEFLIALQACFRYGFPVVILYSTLGEQAIKHGIIETGVSFVITSASQLNKFKAIQSSTTTLKTIIYMEDQIGRADTSGFSSDTRLCTFSSVITLGQSDKGERGTLPTSEDLAVIMYTSGSTGVPKGVMLSHRNILSLVSGALNRLARPSELSERYYPSRTGVCFLPLAHVLEVVFECVLLSGGYRLGYSSALTLTDISSMIKRGTRGDVSVLKPNMMAGVPLIFDRLYKGVMDKVNESSALEKAMFKFAYDYKIRHIEQGFDTPIFNKLIFSKLSSMLGGDMHLMMSGGAALSHSTQRFMQCCFSVCLIQGYGLTETSGAGTVGEPGDFRTRHVGHPLSCSEIKLVEWQEGNYSPRDQPNPRGEIVIGGPNVAMGYYKNDALTAESFENRDGQRWFHTGDIGEILPDGSLRIIDRKKDLVKLQTGEYLSLATVETVLKKCPYVENICIYADGGFDFCVALVVPYRKNLESTATELGLVVKSFDEICTNKQMEQAVLVSMAKVAREGKLQKWEVPRKVKLCTDIWLPEGGLITEAFKLKRRVLCDYYKASLREMYYGK